MSSPLPTPTTAASAGAANYEQTQRQGSTGAQADRVDAPDRDALSQGAQDLLRMQEDVTNYMRGVYQRPEEAYQRLIELDDAGIERFREDPSEIGPLRQGVEPSQDDIGGMVAANGSYDTATEGDRNALQAYNAQDRAHKIQEPSQTRSEDLSPEDQMNRSLAQAPTLTHHLSI